MGAEKTAADLLGDDPAFNDYFKKTGVTKKVAPAKPLEVSALPSVVSRKTNPIDNPLAEYGIPAPGSASALESKAPFFKIGIYVLLAILGILIVFAVFKLATWSG